MIQARIRKKYPARRDAAAFSLDIDFSAPSGVTVLFGPSGSGKTLTLDAIAGLVRPDDGRIVIGGVLVYDSSTGVYLTPQTRRTGYVFQNYALFPHMSLRANLEFAQGAQRVDEMLERFRLSDVSGRRPHELSGGQKQRGSIARALIGNPRVLLLDEPARGLDAALKADLYDILRQVRSEFGTPTLLVTHDLNECFELEAHMLILHDGRLIQSGPARQVVDQPASVEVARLLGRHNLMAVEIRALDPERNISRMAYGDFELEGPFLPGRKIGDRAWMCTRPESLIAHPGVGVPAKNRIAVDLLRAVTLPTSQRLEFSGGIAVESRTDARSAQPLEKWVVEFPPAAIRVL